MRDLEELMLYYESRRGVGHTWTIVHGAARQKNAIVVVMDHRQDRELEASGIDRRRIISVNELEKLRGCDNPIVIDHYALTFLLRDMMNEMQRLRMENAMILRGGADSEKSGEEAKRGR